MKGVKTFGRAPNFGICHSADLPTVTIQTEGDINIILTHPVFKPISNKNI